MDLPFLPVWSYFTLCGTSSGKKLDHLQRALQSSDTHQGSISQARTLRLERSNDSLDRKEAKPW